VSWRLIWTESAQRDLALLDKQGAARVIRTAVRVTESEHGDLKRLKTPLTGYRLRVGGWRLLLEIDEGEGTMRVIRVQHRRQVYDER